ncbi:MAG: GAF domain-containing protein [Chloroflexi bacterium]|nr:GAF domain-containing protein [Chloroflexota bacterium]
MADDVLSADALTLLRSIALRAEVARRLDLGSAEAVLRSVVDATVALFQAEAASIALYDPTKDRLVFRVAAGEQGRGVVGLEVPPSQGLVGYVYTTGQALALSDVARDKRFGRAFAEQTSYVPRSIVAVPLVDEHGTIGVLEVLDKRDEAAFSLRDIELASVFARQAAVAISSSRVERDVATLIGSALTALNRSDGDAAAPPGDGLALENLVRAATADLAGDDDSRLWALVEQVARVRRVDPGQLALVVDLLAVVADHAERAGRARARRR